MTEERVCFRSKATEFNCNLCTSSLDRSSTLSTMTFWCSVHWIRLSMASFWFPMMDSKCMTSLHLLEPDFQIADVFLKCSHVTIDSIQWILNLMADGVDEF